MVSPLLDRGGGNIRCGKGEMFGGGNVSDAGKGNLTDIQLWSWDNKSQHNPHEYIILSGFQSIKPSDRQTTRSEDIYPPKKLMQSPWYGCRITVKSDGHPFHPSPSHSILLPLLTLFPPWGPSPWFWIADLEKHHEIPQWCSGQSPGWQQRWSILNQSLCTKIRL